MNKNEWCEVVRKHIAENYNLDDEAVEDATQDIVCRCFCYGIPTLEELPKYVADYMNR